MDSASEFANYALHEREAHASAGELGGEKGIESLALRLRCHAASVVGDLQANVLTLPQVLRRLKLVGARIPGQTIGDYSNNSITITDGFRCIGHEVHHHLANLRGVCAD